MKLLPASDLLNAMTPPPLELIPGWLTDDTRKMIISGPSKSGKSLFAMELAIALGNGRRFLDLYEQRYRITPDPLKPELYEDVDGRGGNQQRTLYVQAEVSRFHTEDRLRRIAFARGADFAPDPDGADGEYIIAGYPMELLDFHIGPFDLADGERYEELCQLLAEQRRIGRPYHNLILDSLYNVWTPGVNKEDSANFLIARLNNLIDLFDVRVILVHHASQKGEGSGQAFRESMGSTFISSAWMELEWAVWRHEKEDKTVVQLRGRALEPVRHHLQVAYSDGDKPTIVWTEAEAPQTREDKLVDNAAALRLFMEHQGVTVSESGGTMFLTDGWSQRRLAEELDWSQMKVNRALRHIVKIHDLVEEED